MALRSRSEVHVSPGRPKLATAYAQPPAARGTTINVGDTLNLTGATRLLDISSVRRAAESGNWHPHGWPYPIDDAISPNQATPWGLDRGAWASGPNLQYLYWHRINNECSVHPTADAVKGLGADTSAVIANNDGTVSLMSRAIKEPTERPTMNPSNQNALDGATMVAGILSTSGGIRPPFMARVTAKLPAEQAAWPALWVLLHRGGWPPEIDFLEGINPDGRGVQLTATIHPTPGYGVENNTQNLPWPGGKDPTQNFIEYAGLVYDDLIAIFHDGKCVCTWPMFPGGAGMEYFVLVNNTVSSGGWAGGPNPPDRTNFSPYVLRECEVWQMPPQYGSADSTPPPDGGGGGGETPPVDTSATRDAIYAAQQQLTAAENAITQAQSDLDSALNQLP